MKTFRIQPEVLNVNGKLVTILNGEVANLIDLSDREVFSLQKFLKSEKNTYSSIVEQMINRAAVLYEISPENILLKSRKRRIVEARQYSMWLIKNSTKMSLAAIGAEFDKDHATVLHAVRVINTRIETNQLLIKRP